MSNVIKDLRRQRADTARRLEKYRAEERHSASLATTAETQLEELERAIKILELTSCPDDK